MNRAALLIGVSEYEDPGFKPLPSAIADIQAIRRVLLQSSEFSEDQVRVLANPSKHEVEESIYWLFVNRQKQDLLLLYFSGHGIKDQLGKLYFSLPSTRKDERGELMDYTAIPATVLHDRMVNSRSNCQVLVLDCCFSGAFAKGLTVKDDGRVDISTQLGGKGRAIFTSSNSIEYSFQQEEVNLSVYTHFFVEGLEKGAADLDGDGLISTDELHEYVSKKVKMAAPAMTPQFFPVEQGHKIYLARSAQNDPVVEYRKAVEQKVKQGSFQVAKNCFSIPARKALGILGQKLALPIQTTQAIESEVVQPLREYQQKLQDYKQTFKTTLEDEGYPFSEVVQLDLQDYQKLLGLRDEDIQKIEAEVLPDLEQAEQSSLLLTDSSIDRSQDLSAPFPLFQSGPFTDSLDGLQKATGVDLSSPQLITSAQLGAAQAYALKMRRVAENTKKFYEVVSDVSEYNLSPYAASQNPTDFSNFKFEVVTINAKGRVKQRRAGQAEFFIEDLGNGITLEMIKVPGGSFTMGSPDTEEDRLSVESPQHTVTVPTFFIGKFVVTRAQYRIIMGNHPAEFKGSHRPAENVSWDDAIKFCGQLRQKTGRDYRLPSEAEWEYACRAGTTTPFFFGETIISSLVNYDARTVYGLEPEGEYRQETTDVGLFPPNAFGLYDMHGNVWEWCADHWHENYQDAPADGSAWLDKDDCSFRLIRGGSWNDVPQLCRSACRKKSDLENRYINLGFRVACSLR